MEEWVASKSVRYHKVKEQVAVMAIKSDRNREIEQQVAVAIIVIAIKSDRYREVEQRVAFAVVVIPIIKPDGWKD